MARHLVVAHQTATSPLLVGRLTQIAAADPSATFTLLIPATHPKHLLRREEGSHLLHWEAGEAYAIAEERAEEARGLIERAGLRVSGTVVGDESPLLAIEDELRARPSHYDAIVLSTLPPGRSRWLRMDIHDLADRRFALPVVHVCDGCEAETRLGAAGRSTSDGAARRLPALPRLHGRGALAAVVGLAGLYLALAAVLALTVDRGFFVNDAIALVVFAVFLGGLLLGERFAPARRLATARGPGVAPREEEAAGR